MPRRYRPGEVIRVLEHLGWVIVRQRSSHVRLELPDGSYPVTVPTNQRELEPNIFGSVLRQAGLSHREFANLAEEVL